MTFIARIIESLNGIVDWFYQLYTDVYDWPYPFYMIGYIFIEIAYLFNDLAWACYDFSNWIDYVAGKVTNILTWQTIWSYIITYVPNLLTIRDWFVNVNVNINELIAGWWTSTSVQVHGWIDAAVDGIDVGLEGWMDFWSGIWPAFQSAYNTLAAAWSNFYQVTLPGLVDQAGLGGWWDSRLVELEVFINSKIRELVPFYNDLAALWSDIAAFFTDPLTWLAGRLESWFWEDQ